METEGIGETTLWILPDETMVALNCPLWIGFNMPPCRKSTYNNIGQAIGGPNFIGLPDGALWAAGRKYGDQMWTSLARMTPTSFEHVLELPSGGDTSHPGMVWHKMICG